jgi:hypothetical protein
VAGASERGISREGGYARAGRGADMVGGRERTNRFGSFFGSGGTVGVTGLLKAHYKPTLVTSFYDACYYFNKLVTDIISAEVGLQSGCFIGNGL